MYLCPLLCYFDLLFVSAGAVSPISTNGQVGLQRALLCQVHRVVLHARPQICLQQSALACSCYTNSDFSTAPPDTKQPNTFLPHLFHYLFHVFQCWISSLSRNIRQSCNETSFYRASPTSSDLKGPGDDLICPEQLNVLTGLVFEEGGEFS